MPYRNTAVTVCLVDWNTSTNSGQTGDAANITVRAVGDGTEFTPGTPNITEMDSTYMKGVYKVSLAAGENNYSFVVLGGSSSTPNCVLIPLAWSNESNAAAVSVGAGAINNAAFYSDVATTAYASNILQQMIYKLFDLAAGNMTSFTTYSGYAFTAGGFWDVFAKTAWTIRGGLSINDTSGTTTVQDLTGATWKTITSALQDSSGVTTRAVIN